MNTKQNRLRRGIFGLIVIIALTGSGCLGVFQEISINPDGKIETQVRFSISKAMMTALDGMGGEPTETDEIFNLDEGPVNPEEIPGLTNVVVEKLDNDVDVGIRFSGTLSKLPAGIGPEDAPFIPFDEGNTIIIGLPSMEEEEDAPSDPQADEMAALFFASTRYQLVLDKALYPEVYSARVMVGDVKFPASVTELAGSWLVEFPFVTWMQATNGCLLVVEL